MDKHFTSYHIDDRSYVSFVKREIHSLILQGNFDKTRIAHADIVLAELTSNIIKHAGSGEILYRFTNNGKDPSCLELLVIDNGVGMTDVQRMMKDGISTSNTLGQGLGAIQRLTDFFQVYSLPKWGTVCYAVIGQVPAKKPAGLDVRCLLVPKPKETSCGDGFAIRRSETHTMVFFADGLGHGVHAWEAVERGKEHFMVTSETEPVEIIRSMHGEIRKTRGLVGCVAVLNIRERVWRICGVGNIVARLYGGIMFKHYMSYNGIIGLNIPNSMKDTVIEAEKNQQLIMCSDGIRSRWDLARFPSVLKFDHMLLAAALYKDFSRRNDDASILIGKVTLDK